MRFYSDPSRESEKWSLPDCQAFRMTAEEVAETMQDEIVNLMKRREFRLASINPRVRAKMIETLIEENAIKGGWFYQYCFPGCLPEGDPVGPFATCDDAIEACREEASNF